MRVGEKIPKSFHRPRAVTPTPSKNPEKKPRRDISQFRPSRFLLLKLRNAILNFAWISRFDATRPPVSFFVRIAVSFSDDKNNGQTYDIMFLAEKLFF